MLEQSVIFVLLLGGLLLLLGVRLPRRIQWTRAVLPKGKSKAASGAKAYVARLNGVSKESLFIRSRKEAEAVYEQTGQKERFRRTLWLSLLCGAAGIIAGLMLHNIMLASVLAVGLYFLPLWWSQFMLFRYSKLINGELEMALSLITTSYLRYPDVLGAVKENLTHMNEPVKSVFAAFCYNVEYTDPNIVVQILRMKMALDNKIFHQWCDSLILCQDDHTLRDVLQPIVTKFADQKQQQDENETKMMLPVQSARTMIIMAISMVPLFRMVNIDWYINLTGTLFGQVSLAITAICSLATINKAIKLSKPIEYDV